VRADSCSQEKKRLEMHFPLWNTPWTDHSSTSGRIPTPVRSMALVGLDEEFLLRLQTGTMKLPDQSRGDP
jgi:hypothetical protein